VSDDSSSKKLGRRDVVILAGGAVGLIGAGFAGFASKMVFPQPLVYGFGRAASEALVPTPSCGEVELTESYEEGPFYTPNTPQKVDFRRPDHRGRELVLRGLVTDEGCRPIAGAVLDLWHADENATYDNVGYDYRGHQFTAADGTFRLETVVPPPYAFAGLWRAPHVHVKVQGPGTRLLTTQVFLPDPSGVTKHVKIEPSLLARIDEPANGVAQAFFHFVLRRS
jgi:protocatechuate 3,4-dioxygenase beta subunit